MFGCLRGPFVYALQDSGSEGSTNLDEIRLKTENQFTEIIDTYNGVKYLFVCNID